MTKLTVTCYLCGNDSLKIFQGFSWLVECSNCGLVYNPSLSVNSREVSHQFYDIANVSHRRKIQSFLLKSSRDRWRWLLNRLYITKGGRLLELGCGTGEFLVAARQTNWVVDGLELSESFRRAAKEWYGLDLRGEELSQAGLPDESYDVIALIHVFEHLLAPKEVLEQIARIVKPGGWLFIVVPNCLSWTDRIFGKSNPTFTKMDHFFHYTPDTLQRVISQENFDVVDVITYEPKHHIWTSLYGYFGSSKRSSSTNTFIEVRKPATSMLGKLKSNLPYWVGILFSTPLFPLRKWLQKTNQGHEIFLICSRR